MHEIFTGKGSIRQVLFATIGAIAVFTLPFTIGVIAYAIK